MTKTVSLVACLLLCAVVAQAQAELKTAFKNAGPKNYEAMSRAFKTFYEAKLKQHGILGSSFMFLREGQIIDRHVYGLAHREKNLPVT